MTLEKMLYTVDHGAPLRLLVPVKLSGVRPMIETYPLESADEAYAHMMSGNAQLRVVLTM